MGGASLEICTNQNLCLNQNLMTVGGISWAAVNQHYSDCWWHRPVSVFKKIICHLGFYELLLFLLFLVRYYTLSINVVILPAAETGCHRLIKWNTLVKVITWFYNNGITLSMTALHFSFHFWLRHFILLFPRYYFICQRSHFHFLQVILQSELVMQLIFSNGTKFSQPCRGKC